jgi:hypothetical protein
MEPSFGLLIIVILIFLCGVILGYLSVFITARKYVSKETSAIKAFTLTLSAYVGSGILLSTAMEITNDKPGPFGYVIPTQIWIKLMGAMIAWLLAMFGTWQLTKRTYATTTRQTMAIAWQLLGIISLYFGVTVWKLVSWLLQTAAYR